MIPLNNIQLWNMAKEFAASQHKQWSGEMADADIELWQRNARDRTLSYCQDNSPFYRKHLSEIAADTSFDDIPFTTKEHLREHLDDVASLSLDRSWIYYETTGTTGTSTPCPRTAEDSIRTGVALCEGYRDLLGAYGEHLSIALMGPTELHSTGDSFGDVFRSLGHATVKMWPHSPVVGFDRAGQLLQRLDINALTCTPGMTILLARHMESQGVNPRDLGIKVILTVGELATPQLLSQIGDVWGAAVYSSMYASQEASILAVCQPDGALRTTPLNYYYEIIDPVSGQVIDPSLESREGEIVVTHLYHGAKPVVRYRTGDLVRAYGRGQDFTIVPIGRAGDALAIANSEYKGFDFEQIILAGCPSFLDYQVDITEHVGQDHIELRLEPRKTGPKRANDDAAAHARRLSKYFRTPVEVSWGPTDAQTSTGAMVSWKAARIRDHRAITTLEDSSAQRIARQRESRQA